METEGEAEGEEVENPLTDEVAEVQIDFQIEDHHQDLKEEMIAEVHLVKKEMIKEDLSAIEEVTVDHHQNLKEEMIAEVHLVKKMEFQKNHLALKKNLVEIKKILLENLQKNFKNLNLRFDQLICC